jgi:hypothetical protein
MPHAPQEGGPSGSCLSRRRRPHRSDFLTSARKYRPGCRGAADFRHHPCPRPAFLRPCPYSYRPPRPCPNLNSSPPRTAGNRKPAAKPDPYWKTRQSPTDHRRPGAASAASRRETSARDVWAERAQATASPRETSLPGVFASQPVRRKCFDFGGRRRCVLFSLPAVPSFHFRLRPGRPSAPGPGVAPSYGHVLSGQDPAASQSPIPDSHSEAGIHSVAPGAWPRTGMPHRDRAGQR